MTTTDELQDLLAAVEAVRAELFPTLDAGFCRQVVLIEHENADDEAAAEEAIRRAAGRIALTATAGEG